jgi:hypothetical protein
VRLGSQKGWSIGSIAHLKIQQESVSGENTGNAADNFRERDMMYGTAKLMVPVVFEPQLDTTAATTSLTTVGELMQTLDIVRRQE